MASKTKRLLRDAKKLRERIELRADTTRHMGNPRTPILDSAVREAERTVAQLERFVLAEESADGD